MFYIVGIVGWRAGHEACESWLLSEIESSTYSIDQALDGAGTALCEGPLMLEGRMAIADLEENNTKMRWEEKATSLR